MARRNLAEGMIDRLLNEGSAIDALERFTGGTILPGRNVIKGYPVDIDDSDGSYVYMRAVDKDAATGLVKLLRQGGVRASADKQSGIMVSSS